jgi:tripartite-type tricarboxylate transporter receptor subunit TctC
MHLCYAVYVFQNIHAMEETVVRTARAIALIVFAALGLAATGATAQYPERPIRLIYPYTAGGAGDALARLFADRLSTELGVQMFVDNRPGAGGNTGAVAAAAAAGDGYTLFSVSPAFAINASLHAAPGYDPVRDFIPVAPLSVVPNVLLVSASFPPRTVQALVAHARANPGTVNFGSSGVGTSIHLAGEMLKREAKIDIVHVPYRGSSQAGIDLLGGQLQMMFDSAPTAIANVRTGRAFAIAVASKTRLPELPDVPTMAEAGFPTIESEAWTGIVAPLRTPPAVIARIHAASVRALNDPVLLDRLKQIGGRPFTGSPEDFGAFIRNEVTRFSVIVKEADIKPE